MENTVQRDLFPETLIKHKPNTGEYFYCNRCKEHKHESEYNDSSVKALKGIAGYSARGTATCCRSCRKEYTKQKNAAESKATRPSAPYPCDCCGTILHGHNKIMIDHCHDTGNFRGWVCRKCNTGIGNLGDTIEGLQRAIKYLESSQ